MSKTRVIAALVLAVAALAATSALPALRGLRNSTVSGSDVAVYEVRRGDFKRRVYADGNLQATNATRLGPPPEVMGSLKIAWLHDDGTPVSEGEVVIRFDPTEMEKDLQDGRHDQAATDSRITQTTVREESKSRNLERDAEMADHELEYARTFSSKDPEIFSRSAIIESGIDEELAGQRKVHSQASREVSRDLAQTELDLLAIERRKAELKIEQAQQKLRALEVRAPHDGIFVLKGRWGRLPQVGEVVWGGFPIAEIPRLDEMEAKVYVLEADAGGLDAGLDATVELDAHRGRTFKAEVEKVDALAQRRNRRSPVQYFGVVLELERTEVEIMKPGQRLTAVITVDELQDVVTVPRQAVFEVEGESVVYVRRGRRFEPVEVRLGPAALGRVVVEDGVAAGDRIALRDPTRPQEPSDEESEESEPGPVGSSVGASL